MDDHDDEHKDYDGEEEAVREEQAAAAIARRNILCAAIAMGLEAAEDDDEDCCALPDRRHDHGRFPRVTEVDIQRRADRLPPLPGTGHATSAFFARELAAAELPGQQDVFRRTYRLTLEMFHWIAEEIEDIVCP
jgi:hypothetical protein